MYEIICYLPYIRFNVITTKVTTQCEENRHQSNGEKKYQQ